MRRAIAIATAVALLAAAVGAYAAFTGTGASERLGPIDGPPVRITGNVTGLYPGATTLLNATARNRTDRPVRLGWVKTRVRNPVAGCDRLDLHAAHIRPATVIPPHGVLPLQIPVTMAATTTDACQGARFPLRFLARTRPAR
jgi:hypothetical protein